LDKPQNVLLLLELRWKRIHSDLY